MKNSKINFVFFILLPLICTNCNWTLQETTSIPEPCAVWECGCEITDADGNTYRTVKIGSQCWMAENLNTGKMLSPYTKSEELYKYCLFNSLDSCEKYGAFYTWDMVSRKPLPQGICPDGWVVPSDIDWKKMEEYLEILPSEIDMIDNNCIRGKSSKIKTKLLELDFNPLASSYVVNHFGTPCIDNDTTCFGAALQGRAGIYWTRTDTTNNNEPSVFSRRMFENCDGMNRSVLEKNRRGGYCLRCIKEN